MVPAPASWKRPGVLDPEIAGHKKMGAFMRYSLARVGIVFVAAAVVGLGGTAAGLAAEPGKTVRIGALVDQTGASTTPLFRNAVELAAKQMNEGLAKAASPFAVEVVFGDTKSAPPQAVSEALRLINDETVKALVSDNSGVTAAVNKLNYDPASKAAQKVPITCFQCSSSALNDPAAIDADAVTQAALRDTDNWLFRVFYDAKVEAAVIAQVALQKAGKEPGKPVKIGIFADGGHKSVATLIPEKLPSFHSGPVSTEIIYMSTADKIGADWARVVDDRNETTGQTDGTPDVVIVAMLPAGATEAIRTYRQGGYKIPILSNNSFRRDYILKQVGAPADGLEGSSVTLADTTGSGAAFIEAFKAMTGQPPEVTSAGAYDAAATLMLAALQAIGGGQMADVSPAAIREGLTKINDKAGAVVRPTVEGFAAAAQALRQGKPINYEGAYHSIDWDAVGNMYPPMVHWKVEGQKFVEYELYDCNPQTPLCPPKK